MDNYKDLVMQARKRSLALTIKQQKEVLRIYESAIDELAHKARKAKAGSLTERWATDYLKQVENSKFELQKALDESMKRSIMQATRNAVAPDLQLFARAQKKAGVDIGDRFIDMFSKVPSDVVNDILRGGLYADGKGLSERIWRLSEGFGDDVGYMVKRGLIEKKSAYELARDLEMLVKPESRRPWSWGTVYPNNRTKQIDYNAQRLARTSITHAHRESQYRSAAANPFVEAVRWELSGEHYSRQVSRWGEDECDEYANQNWYGLGTGNFPVDRVPLGHPQCLCVTYPVVTKTLDDIAGDLKAWVEG